MTSSVMDLKLYEKAFAQTLKTKKQNSLEFDMDDCIAASVQVASSL